MMTSMLNAARVGLNEHILEKYQENLDQVLPLKEQLQHTVVLLMRSMRDTLRS